MFITPEQLQNYEHDGFLVLPNLFSAEEIATIKKELPTIFAEDSPRRVLEKDRSTVRSVYGTHMTNKLFNHLSQHPRIANPAAQILGSGIYIYQFKINMKAAFSGDIWAWHQDYIFWRNEDGMPAARVINAVIFLDDVSEFNGPLILIPGSHKENVINTSARDEAGSLYQNSPAWISNLTADLKYSLGKETIARLVEKYGLIAPKGDAGTVLFFHGNLVHGSATNMSPFDRMLVLVTYNSLENIPTEVANPRPDFLACRDPQPVELRSDDILLV